MADDADKAAPNIESMVTDGIAKVRREMERSLPYIGVCHWCESPVPPGRIFCSIECSQDKYNADEARKRNGYK